MQSMLGRICGIVVFCVVVVAPPALAKYLVRDADGGPPVEFTVMIEKVKLKESRKRVAKSGLPKPKKGHERRTFYYSGSEKRVKFERLQTATGEVLIEGIYASVDPLSTVAALVKRDDGVWGIVDIPTGTFRPLPDASWYYTSFNGAAPAVLLIGSSQPDGTFRYCFTGADGECEKWVDRVAGDISAELEDGPSGFIFQTRIVMNRLTPEGQKYSSSFDWNGNALLEKAPPVVPVHSANPKNLKQRVLHSVLYNLGPFDHPLGDYSTNLYWPMDKNGAPIEATENFKGLFPLFLANKKGETFETAGQAGGGAAGYVIVYEQDGTRTFEIAPNNKYAASVIYHNDSNYRWSDLYYKNMRNNDYFDTYRFAVKRDGRDESKAWYPVEYDDRQESLHKFLEEAWNSDEGYADPVVAIDTRYAKNTAAAKAAQDAADARYKQRKDALAALKSRGGTMSVGGDLCGAAYNFTVGRTDEASRLFFQAYYGYDGEVCRYLPTSLYSAMMQSKVVQEEQAPPPPEPENDFASAMKAWNDQLDQDRSSRQGKSLRCYVNQGKRTCYYN
ncbi:hypothetical protein HAD_05960 [Hyphomonas adhaerens MHS-3]|uniref:Uncharacterized protein n=1 Tax=Hyphomonas adhaerens MHS-3 TaxID=1280949 RepID=A0A069E563_9PROT|nr:hypothetical protein [Hyphomonas adhaerens]KCZ85203.1 hypothetical protein HAD_05960 [Hyphomonas adhaerens MHS-3]